MSLKYQKEIDGKGLVDCTPEEYLQSAMIAFRFVLDDLLNQNNFKPVGLIRPQRLTDFKEDAQNANL